jgi:hypothetical protein
MVKRQKALEIISLVQNSLDQIICRIPMFLMSMKRYNPVSMKNILGIVRKPNSKPLKIL